MSGSIIFLPVDVPRFPVDLIPEDMLAALPEGSKFDFTIINRLMAIVDESVVYGRDAIGYSMWHPSVPDAVRAYFTEVLPFRHLADVSAFRQTGHILPHIDYRGDETMRRNGELFDDLRSVEPSGYKVFVRGPRAGSHYLTIGGGSKKVLVEVPEDTDVFLIPTATCKHGALWNGPKTVLNITGWLDHDRHRLMVERSLRRYGRSVIYEDALT